MEGQCTTVFFSLFIRCVTHKKRKILHKMYVLPGPERSRGQSSQKWTTISAGTADWSSKGGAAAGQRREGRHRLRQRPGGGVPSSGGISIWQWGLTSLL